MTSVWRSFHLPKLGVIKVLQENASCIISSYFLNVFTQILHVSGNCEIHIYMIDIRTILSRSVLLPQPENIRYYISYALNSPFE